MGEQIADCELRLAACVCVYRAPGVDKYLKHPERGRTPTGTGLWEWTISQTPRTRPNTYRNRAPGVDKISNTPNAAEPDIASSSAAPPLS